MKRCVQRARRPAFTLIELLAVMALMAMLFGTGIAAYTSMKQGAAMRQATTRVRGQLAAAREFAVARSREVTLVLNSNTYYMYYWRGNTTVTSHQTTNQFLPRHVYLTDLSDQPLDNLEMRYLPDGSTGIPSNATFRIVQRGNREGFEVRVQGLTGMTTFHRIETTP